MKYLLDTCVFIWLCDEPEALSARVRELCDRADSELYLSTASIWEMQIKADRGRLTLSTELTEAVQSAKMKNRLKILQINEANIYGLRSLPSIHGDPFDRMLIAQAKDLNASIVTCDEKIKQYPVNVIW